VIVVGLIHGSFVLTLSAIGFGAKVPAGLFRMHMTKRTVEQRALQITAPRDPSRLVKTRLFDPMIEQRSQMA
jgi:hypothetical protein